METTNADEALDRLKQGNERFRTGRAQGPDRGGSRHEELIKGQQPFAIILTCSDSRVPAEIVFDAGRSARINAERLIAESDIIRAATEESGVRIVTAFFHFSNGEAEFDKTA